MSEDKILLAHGSGGKLTHDLIQNLFLKKFSNPLLDKLDDMATFDLTGSKFAFTTDSYVVNPLFFPGGDIGKLSICGTVNDLAMSGATPKFLSVGFLIEEGLSISELERILDSMAEAAAEAEVEIVTGDTKVVDRGSLDKLFINTAGIGVVPDGTDISGANARLNDKVILSGSIGDHGIAVLSQREGLTFRTRVVSDCAPLNKMVADMLAVSKDIRSLRDPTRGGLAGVLNEIAEQSGVSINVEESCIPISPEVIGACDMLGFDPYHVANEGKLVAIVDSRVADDLVAVMRQNPYGKETAIIGEVVNGPAGRVSLKTAIGSTRILDMLVGEQLPRIC